MAASSCEGEFNRGFLITDLLLSCRCLLSFSLSSSLRSCANPDLYSTSSSQTKSFLGFIKMKRLYLDISSFVLKACSFDENISLPTSLPSSCCGEISCMSALFIPCNIKTYFKTDLHLLIFTLDIRRVFL